jgi:hypothetical protein
LQLEEMNVWLKRKANGETGIPSEGYDWLVAMVLGFVSGFALVLISVNSILKNAKSMALHGSSAVTEHVTDKKKAKLEQ